jgi:predicted proteasome-type protease
MLLATITTDWIQAFGILISIPVATWGIVSLFRKDKNRQKEIESLTSLAQNQAVMIEKIAEQIEIEKKKHLYEIRPLFDATFKILGRDYDIHIEFINKEKRAILKEIRQIRQHDKIFSIPENINKFIDTGGKIQLKVTGSENEASALFFSGYILYQDTEGNNYYQIFDCQDKKVFIKSPIFFSGQYEDIRFN